MKTEIKYINIPETVDELLQLLPKQVVKDGRTFWLNIAYCPHVSPTIEYADFCKDGITAIPTSSFRFHDEKDLVENAGPKLLKWCRNNGYIE